jgi:hypothetical protein
MSGFVQGPVILSHLVPGLLVALSPSVFRSDGCNPPLTPQCSAQCGIITVSSVSKEPAPVDSLLSIIAGLIAASARGVARA